MINSQNSALWNSNVSGSRGNQKYLGKDSHNFNNLFNYPPPPFPFLPKGLKSIPVLRDRVKSYWYRASYIVNDFSALKLLWQAVSVKL